MKCNNERRNNLWNVEDGDVSAKFNGDGSSYDTSFPHTTCCYYVSWDKCSLGGKCVGCRQ